MTQAFSTARILRFAFPLLTCAGLVACDMVPPPEGPALEPGVLEATRNGPEGAPPGSCWGRTVSPAVFETITEQVQVEPAKINPDGTIAKPPVYRSETRQQIDTPRRDNWFATPCPEVLTTEFVASLQRALSARGLYQGPANGVMNAETRSAVQTLQQPTGPDSGVLSLDAARRLGLIAVDRE